MSQYADENFLENIEGNLKYKKNIFDGLNFNKFYNPYSEEIGTDLFTFKKNKDYYYSKKLFLQEVMDYDQGYFEYKLNENLFRCKNFSKFDSGKFNLLVLGCSITAGVGLPEDMLWFNRVVDKLGLDKNSTDVYNLSINGSGVSNLIRNANTFIKTVGRPDMVLMLLPQSTRGLIWNKDFHRFQIAHYEPAYLNFATNRARKKDKFSDKFIEYYMDIYSHEDVLMQRSIEINSFEYLCEAYGINLLWATWNFYDQKVYEQMGFSNFFDSQCSNANESALVEEFHRVWFPDYGNYAEERAKKVKELNKSNIHNEPYWEIARDGQHPGGYYHEKRAHFFVDEIKRRKML